MGGLAPLTEEIVERPRCWVACDTLSGSHPFEGPDAGRGGVGVPVVAEGRVDRCIKVAGEVGKEMGTAEGGEEREGVSSEDCGEWGGGVGAEG